MRAAQALRRSRSAATPAERLLDAGLRMAELRDEDAVLAALVAEARALVGARRVLVAAAAAEGFVVGAAHVPRGQNARTLLAVVAPLLEQAKKSRGAALCAMPVTNGSVMRRRCVVVRSSCDRVSSPSSTPTPRERQTTSTTATATRSRCSPRKAHRRLPTRERSRRSRDAPSTAPPWRRTASRPRTRTWSKRTSDCRRRSRSATPSSPSSTRSSRASRPSSS
jgi:hypothetical protein